MSAEFWVGNFENHTVCRITGTLRFDSCQPLKEILNTLLLTKAPLLIDLTQCDAIDSTAIGTFAQVLQKYAVQFVVSMNIYRQLEAVNFEQLFKIHIAQAPPCHWQLISPTKNSKPTKKNMRHLMIEAHEQLIQIDKKNESDYRKVIDCLNRSSPTNET